MSQNRRRMKNERETATETRARRVDGNIRNFIGDGISYNIRKRAYLEANPFRNELVVIQTFGHVPAHEYKRASCAYSCFRDRLEGGTLHSLP